MVTLVRFLLYAIAVQPWWITKDKKKILKTSKERKYKNLQRKNAQVVFTLPISNNKYEKIKKFLLTTQGELF